MRVRPGRVSGDTSCRHGDGGDGGLCGGGGGGDDDHHHHHHHGGLVARDVAP